jgi:hypothetical protein
MRGTTLLVLLVAAASLAAPAGAAPTRAVASVEVGSRGITAPVSVPVDFGQIFLGKVADAAFTLCFEESRGACDQRGRVALVQGLDSPFFIAGVFREVIATGAVSPVSFPVVLQPGQRLKVIFLWAADRLSPATSTVALRVIPADGSPSEDVEVQFRGTGTQAVGCFPFFALCLQHGRFKVEGRYLTPTAVGGPAHAVALTTDTGYFTFFDPANVEAVVKILDACAFNQKFWVFAGGLTNVHTLLTVTDLAHDTVKIYVNPQGHAFEPVQDTSAFATCP